MQRFLLQLFLVLCVPALTYAQVSVLTQHNNTYRTGWNDQETVLNPGNVSGGKFGLVSTLALDDQAYAQPLIAANITIGNFTGTVLFVATVNNTVYAFNADDVSSPAPLWQTNLNPAGQRTPDIFDLSDPVTGKPCGGGYRDFSGNLGLVGTPVIDPVSQTLYVATKTIDANGKFYSYLNALDITTGQHRSSSPKLMSAQAVGSGDGNVNGVIDYDAKYQNQRPALLLYNNTVYVASASHCDWGPYHGWILGYDAASLDLKYTYNATPNGWAAGIWMAGQGISVGDDGNLYVATGNGTTSQDNNDFTGGRSESLLKLSPELTLLDWFTPANYEYLDQYDLDYGCDGVLMIPNTSLTVSGSKEGISYVVDYNNMGRFTPGNTQVNDILQFNPSNTGFVHVHGSPVYAKLGGKEYVYAWAESFKIRQFEFQRDSSNFSDTFKQGSRNLDNGMPGAMLSVSSNGQDESSAVVWACFPTSGNANNQVRPGTMSAYRADDVSAGEIWNTGMNVQDDLGNFAKFNSPTIANGKVFAPTFSNNIKVYGLTCDNALTNLQYGNGIGLKAEYYSNTVGNDFPATADLVQLDKSVNHNWGADSPLPNISKDNFKVRWTGKLRPLTDDDYTIYVTASDAVRLWINNVLVIDHWSAGAVNTYNYTLALQKSIDYDVVMEYFSQNNSASCILQWSAQGICKTLIPASQLIPPQASCVGNGTGVKAEYFSNTAPTAPFPAVATVTKIEPTIDFNWGQGAPAGISNDWFKARFTGNIQSTDAGTYTFYITIDDGVRLWVNNQLIVNAWIDQEGQYEATINLEACTDYPIRLEYYENGGDAVCKLSWSGPIFGSQPISVTQLSGTNDPGQDAGFTLYPNPANDLVTIESQTAFASDGLVEIFNLLGKKVSEDIVVKKGGDQVEIPVSALPNGVYVATVKVEGRSYIRKFVKI
ncbi:MAG: PA14 domain-containing protein [Bacteroidota bacterium]